MKKQSQKPQKSQTIFVGIQIMQFFSCLLSSNKQQENQYYNNKLTEKITITNMPIFDWFIIATPLFSIIIILTILALKTSLKNQIKISQDIMIKLKHQQSLKQETSETSITQKYKMFKILSFLIKNQTFLELCTSKKSKNKLSTLVSFSSIANLCLLYPSLFMNSIIGIPIAVVFVLAQVCFETQNNDVSIMDGQAEQITYQKQQEKPQDSILTKTKCLFILYSIISVGLSLYLCGITFKNYSNSLISTLLLNFVINSILDFFIVRPLGFVILSIPLCFNSKVVAFINNEKLRDSYVQQGFISIFYIRNVHSTFSPQKKVINSPQKIPKLIQNKENINNEAINNVLEIVKKIKKQKFINQQLIKPLGNRNIIKNIYQNQQQQTLNELFYQQNNYQINSPIKRLNDQNQNGDITKRKDNQLVIIQFKQQYNQQSQQNHINHQKQQKNINYINSNLHFQNHIHKLQQQPQPQSVYQKQINFIKSNKSILSNHQDQTDAKTTINHQKLDQLKIYKNSDDESHMQEIDTNSPERRRHRQTIEVDNSQFKLKKKSKIMHGNARKRVIKYSSGQPYLQYLPNMLAKQQIKKHKKSQPFINKPEIEFIEDKRKSFRKTNSRRQTNKIHYANDQNHYPGTLEIDDL